MLHKLNEIIINYYKGAYGPTIRLDTNSKNTLKALKDVINKVMNYELDDFSFCKWDKVSLNGLNDLLLKLEKRGKHYYEVIQIIEVKDELPKFIWTQTEDEWYHIQGLIDGLICDNGSGHQYLTNESDGILIELAFMEL